MRKNIRQIWGSWLKGEAKTMGSVRTDGESIFSYQTEILRKGDGHYWLNIKKYSVTTSQLQNSLRTLLYQEQMLFKEYT